MPEPERTPEALIGDLLLGSPENQATAAAALEALGTTAGPALCAALRDTQSAGRALHLALDNLDAAPASDPWRRREETRLRREIAAHEEWVCRLARVLHAVRDDEALQPLFEALRRSHSREAHALALALAPMGPAAVPLLDEALESRLLWVAMSAAEALTAIGGPEVAGLLLHRLETATHDLLRVCLIRSLGRLGDPSAVETLCTLAASGTRDERVYAIEALGRIGDPRALDPVLRCLTADAAYSSDLALPAAALRALGGLADPRSIPALVSALQDARTPLHAPALEALTQIADRRPALELRLALPALRQRQRYHLAERESLVRARLTLADRIETLTQAIKALPVPAAAAPANPDQLPIPNEGPTFRPEELPIPNPEPPSAPTPRGSLRWLPRRRP